jgi:DNA-binding MarR family transcriptional regulator
MAGRRRSDAIELDEITDSVLLASRALVAVAARSVAAVENEVTLPQYRALVVLASRGPVTAGDLAEQLDVHASTVTRLCDRLVAKGLVDRGVAEHNRREVVLEITPAGGRIVYEVTAVRRREISRIIRKVPPELRIAMIEALRAFGEAAGELPEQSWSLGWRAR